MNKRKRNLLRGMAEDLQNGTPPLNEGFLTENRVTLNECIEMSEMAGNILAGYLMLDHEIQIAVITQAAFDEKDKNIAGVVFRQFIKQYFSERTVKELGELVSKIREQDGDK